LLLDTRLVHYATTPALGHDHCCLHVPRPPALRSLLIPLIQEHEGTFHQVASRRIQSTKTEACGVIKRVRLSGLAGKKDTVRAQRAISADLAIRKGNAAAAADHCRISHACFCIYDGQISHACFCDGRPGTLSSDVSDLVSKGRKLVPALLCMSIELDHGASVGRFRGN